VIAELPYPEIAAELRCSESVVRQRVSRGLAVLRNLTEEGP
jgi:DNA-directed RNA polymerase specialized sigma24 family protein